MAGDGFQIDPAELAAHQQHLGGVTDRIRTAHGAADESLDQGAFGGFGIFMAIDCARSQRAGADAIRTVLEAADEHSRDVGAWANDLDTRELDLRALFSTAPEATGA